MPPGRIESVHAAAINIRFGSLLATIARESVGGLPMGILVSGEQRLDHLGAVRGMAARVHGSDLVVPDAGLLITLYGAATWSPVMPILPIEPIARRTGRTAAVLRLAVAIAPRAGLAPLLAVMAGDTAAARGTLAEQAGPVLAGVLGLLQREETALAAHRAQSLIGLGPGATPSGDDLLVGLLAGMAATRHPQASSLAWRVAIRAPGRTTALSEQFLADAGRLRFSERVHNIATAVLAGRPAELGAAIDATLAWGASSGADLLVGLLIGIDADRAALGRSLRDLAGDVAEAA